MSSIKTVKAFSNGEIAYITWTLDAMIPDCLGFEITRVYPDDPSENTVLPAWVAFEGQSNDDWLPQNTSVWPVQRLSWKDLTLRKRRNQLSRRTDETNIQYLVRPIVQYATGLEEVVTDLPKTYTGNKVRLSYLDAGRYSDIIRITLSHGSIRATFTNGILATQWLAHTMQDPTFKDIKKEIRNRNSPIRKYLAADVLETLMMLIEKTKNNPSSTLKMALYELEDEELFEAIGSVKEQIEIVLSNTSNTSRDPKIANYDKENSRCRKILHDSNVKIMDRMFNNNGIGHNKFVVYLEDGEPKMVMTGSTNWTSNGLCAQSNNAVVIDSKDVAALYDDYFEALKQDTALFKIPNPLSDKTDNTAGMALRKRNAQGNKPVKLPDGTEIKVWFSPNTPQSTVKKEVTPPDLSEVYSIMRKAEKAIFFAMFMPGRANNRTGDVMTNVITEAITLGEKDNSLMVYGAISDPTAMPNYVTPKRGVVNPPTPFTYDNGTTHIIRAANFSKKTKTRGDDLIGNFEAELLSAGHAIIHDKVVVIDPFSDNGVVVFGSHNCGFKASYQNDENLLIIKNNPSLVKAFALHVLDLFEHYRFRAIQADRESKGQKRWSGFLSRDGKWLEQTMSYGGKGDLAEYINS